MIKFIIVLIKIVKILDTEKGKEYTEIYIGHIL